MDAQKICALIDVAFSSVERPPERFVAANPADLEAPYVHERFAGKYRSDVEGKLEFLDTETLSAMSADGIHYYLPAFLKQVVADPGACDLSLSNGVIRFLDLAKNRQYFKYPKFSREQKESIIQVLDFMKKNIGLYELGALERSTSADIERITRDWQDNN